MKYTPKLPDSDINISKENNLLYALKLLVSLIVSALIIFMILRVVLYFVIDTLPPSYEKRLTKFISSDSIDLGVGDTKPNQYLSELIDSLNRCAKLPYDIKVYVIPETKPNAFALPGGSIYVTRGMLRMVKDQNELISVLGHEMGHFKNRDHLKSMGVNLLFSLLALVVGDSYGTILNTTFDISNIKYSQKAEIEADRYGVDLMECAFGSVTHATTLFERMDDKESFKYFFATHPAFGERIEKMKAHIKDRGYDDSKPPIPLKEKF